ncbi:MAG: glycosyltransferase family 2 protein [Nitrospina sp.]|jgi:glycosyltransferase involved in cell wall biosynthesis|nr:glycosyltransferase family 2 protein [Nitrospina sp.]
MFKDKVISIVVPAHNEQKLIQKVLQSIPHWVDHIFVINDGSSDATSEKVRERMESDSRIQLICHKENRGVGAAICSGYKTSLENEVDIAVVMAGDAQMDPENLESLILPVAEEGVDYTKGNRLFDKKAWEIIPRHRYIGNSILSLLTKIASGYWHIADTQCGYTAISKKAMQAVDLDNVYPRYGMPNDLLVKLNVADCTVRDVPVRPVYNIGEVSGIRISRVVITISRLLLHCFFSRLVDKYVIRDFHPLVFFYTLGLIAFPAGFITGIYLFLYRIFTGPVSTTSALFAAFLIISGLQFLLFAMWFDMENNKSLKG